MGKRSHLLLPIKHAIHAAVVLFCHLGIIVIILSCIRAVEIAIHYIFDQPDPLLFDKFPLRYLFHAMDLGVIVLFITYGLMDTARAFRR
jgi:hypothetical protein